MNIKEFNLISRVNEAIFFIQHESCECKYEDQLKMYIKVKMES